MRIAISAGHNVYVNGYFDNGTSGFGRREATEVKEMVVLLAKMLRDKGHVVMDVTPYNQRFRSQRAAHQKRADSINSFKPDLYLDIHLNAGGGTGPETIVYSTTSPAYKWARKITNSIAKQTGLTNRRGVRVRPGLMSVNMQPAPSIIVEGGFMDTKQDMDSLTPLNYARSVSDVFPDLKQNTTKKEEKDMKKRDIKINFDGTNKRTKGIFEDGVNYIPIRFLEDIGYCVEWDSVNDRVKIESLKDISVMLDGKKLSTRGIFQQSRNFIPIRFLEELGFEVSWEQKTQTVSLKSGR